MHLKLVQRGVWVYGIKKLGLGLVGVERAA